MKRAPFLAGAAGALLSPLYTAASSLAAGRERVAIVGAGIAGLSCALTLRDAGIDATVFESSTRVGGRMHSEWGYWDEAQHTEWCGSMIDSKHHTMHALARRFGLPLVDSWKTLQPGARDTAYVNRGRYLMTQADTDFAPVYATLQRQLGRVGRVTTYDSATPLARTLDAMSMAQWIDRYIPGGRTSRLGKTVDVALMNENGVPSEAQSALNLVYMLGIQNDYGPRGGTMNVLGYSDQRYFIGPGNQRLPMAVAASLPAGSIRFGYRLSAIARTKGGAYQLRFASPSGTVTETYDRVVLAIPFIILRGVDYSRAGFDALKSTAIQELGYGIHTKLQMQFHERAWYQPGPWEHPADGQIWTDLGFQNSVDFSLAQPGRSGIIERFMAGPQSLADSAPLPYARIQDSPAVAAHVKEFFTQLDVIWPGVSKHWNGKATFGNAQVDPNIQASYSCWLVGQQTKFAGYEGVRQGRVHFAGEHCSVEHQGFMEGAASTGVAAAREILTDYGVHARA
jgi:monoamine oxidase